MPQCCDGEPTMLYWINSVHGLENWQFGCRRKESLQTESPVTFERYIPDIRTGWQRDIPLNTAAVEVWEVADEQVERQFVDGLREIYHSPFVAVLMPDNRLYRVLLTSGSFATRSYDAVTERFYLQFKLPRLWTLSN